MRIYIIGNAGITLCREPPAAVNEGEIAVASGAELHAARLSGKRLLALWNALPAIEKRRKVGRLAPPRCAISDPAELVLPEAEDLLTHPKNPAHARATRYEGSPATHSLNKPGAHGSDPRGV